MSANGAAGLLPINKSPVDFYTLIHAGLGAGLAVGGVSMRHAVMVAIAWELIETPLKHWAPALFRYGDPSEDTPENAVLDTAAVILGHWLVSASRKGGAGG